MVMMSIHEAAYRKPSQQFEVENHDVDIMKISKERSSEKYFEKKNGDNI